MSRPNTGYGVALNRMLALARGAFITRMDPDDVCLPERLAKQVAFMAARPDVVAVGTGVVHIEEFGIELDVEVVPTDHETIDSLLLKGMGGAIRHPTLMMRRAAFEQVGGYDERYPTAQDLDLFLRLGEVGRLANLQEPLLKYRLHKGSANVAKAKQQVQRAQAIVDEARRRRGIAEPFQVPDWSTRQTPMELYAAWGWRVLQKGYWWAAFRYGARMVVEQPANPLGYRLMACAIRGY